ncbi:MAG: hypothetical protein LBD96_10485, partial [Treponema sp.]|nr:hypothetical protein [Treponema sp.]
EELAEAGYTLATLSEGKYVKASQGGAYISFTSDKDISGAELYYVLTSDKVTEVEGYSSYTKLTLGENTLATVAVGNSPYTYSNIFIPNFDSTSGRRKVFLKLIKEGKVSNTLSITGKATITIDPDTGTGISANS